MAKATAIFTFFNIFSVSVALWLCIIVTLINLAISLDNHPDENSFSENVTISFTTAVTATFKFPEFSTKFGFPNGLGVPSAIVDVSICGFFSFTAVPPDSKEIFLILGNGKKLPNNSFSVGLLTSRAPHL